MNNPTDAITSDSQLGAGKYVYTIRSANGVIVKNLQIYGKSKHDADEKLQQMYRRCEVLSCGKLIATKTVSLLYEDVLDTVVLSCLAASHKLVPPA